jgi:phasin family protein
MYNEMIEKTLGQLPAVPEAVVKFNKLAVAKFEKFAHLQFDTYKAFTELTLDQLKAVAEVSDSESLKALWDKQMNVVKNVRVQNDCYVKALTDLSSEFNSEFKQLTGEAVNKAA